jgi:hypothetical protein
MAKFEDRPFLDIPDNLGYRKLFRAYLITQLDTRRYESPKYTPYAAFAAEVLNIIALP